MMDYVSMSPYTGWHSSDANIFMGKYTANFCQSISMGHWMFAIHPFYYVAHMHGLVQDCSNYIIDALLMPESSLNTSMSTSSYLLFYDTIYYIAGYSNSISHNATFCIDVWCVCPFLLQNGVLWGICPMHCGICGICETCLFASYGTIWDRSRKFYTNTVVSTLRGVLWVCNSFEIAFASTWL